MAGGGEWTVSAGWSIEGRSEAEPEIGIGRDTAPERGGMRSACQEVIVRSEDSEVMDRACVAREEALFDYEIWAAMDMPLRQEATREIGGLWRGCAARDQNGLIILKRHVPVQGNVGSRRGDDDRREKLQIINWKHPDIRFQESGRRGPLKQAF
ncbi:hypothetical protein CALVIDRAFT_532065 [Calocera viscosa TUFC12733]|uniref:Uncharacterized protein n=1 Tax=Calocera viscosa (strain TUFC12733) TaxID=1330018 RepID=A0A167FGW7_CALVF|nr:hypothetical protein CALVIDRAFT_532065 [Calocera viscosa TUFC12733]